MPEQRIVSPSQVDVLDDKGDNRLTLAACHPKYSARERIIVVAQLDPAVEALPPPPRPNNQGGTPATPHPEHFRGLDGEGRPVWAPGLPARACAPPWLFARFLPPRSRQLAGIPLAMPFLKRKSTRSNHN